MNFMGIGPLEFLIILILALLFFGPEKLPGIARDVGRTVRSFREATTGITREINTQIAQVEEETKSATRAAEAQAPASSQGAIPRLPSIPYQDASDTAPSDGEPKS